MKTSFLSTTTTDSPPATYPRLNR